MTRHIMNLYPFDDCVRAAEELIRKNVVVHQQWNCEHCGAKQTMEMPDIFYETGECEECHRITNIRRSGCNYMVHATTREATEALLKKMGGDK